MLSALVAAALAGSGAGVSLGTAVNVSAEDTEALLVQLDAALREAGLTPRRVASRCKGEATCVGQQVADEGLEAIVTVAVAGSRRGLAVDLEASSATGQTLGQLTAHFSSAADAKLREAFSRYAAELGLALAPPKPQAEPPPVVAPAPIAHVEPAPAARGAPRWTVATAIGLAGAGAGTSLALGLLGFSMKSDAERVEGGRAVHTEVRAQALVDGANAQLTAALVCAATAAAFTVLAIVLGLSRS